MICAGQESRRDLADAIESRGLTRHTIGGAKLATKLDAERAIGEAGELAATLS